MERTVPAYRFGASVLFCHSPFEFRSPSLLRCPFRRIEVYASFRQLPVNKIRVITAVFVYATEISDDYIKYCNAACIMENMLLQAAALGLDGTYIWGCFRKLRANEAVLKKLQLPDGYEILSAMAIGYPAQKLKERSVCEKIKTTIL